LFVLATGTAARLFAGILGCGLRPYLLQLPLPCTPSTITVLCIGCCFDQTTRALTPHYWRWFTCLPSHACVRLLARFGLGSSARGAAANNMVALVDFHVGLPRHGGAPLLLLLHAAFHRCLTTMVPSLTEHRWLPRLFCRRLPRISCASRLRHSFVHHIPSAAWFSSAAWTVCSRCSLAVARICSAIFLQRLLDIA